MHRFNRFIAGFIVLLCASSAFAQNTNSGDIRGTATDAAGAVVPGATVHSSGCRQEHRDNLRD
jgi:hypothetical protein